jgi:apolipoprotein N-acyltransferase
MDLIIILIVFIVILVFWYTIVARRLTVTKELPVRKNRTHDNLIRGTIEPQGNVLVPTFDTEVLDVTSETAYAVYGNIEGDITIYSEDVNTHDQTKSETVSNNTFCFILTNNRSIITHFKNKLQTQFNIKSAVVRIIALSQDSLCKLHTTVTGQLGYIGTCSINVPNIYHLPF